MIRITTEWQGVQGAPYYSNMFFDGVTEAEASAAATAAGVFWTAIADRIYTNLSGEVLGDHAVVDPASGQTTQVYSGTPIAINCTDASPQMPPTVQGLIRWRSGVFVAGREVRGRTFVPVPSEASNTTGGLPEAVYTADLQAAADALVSGSTLLCWSRVHGQTAAVSGASVWGQWATLRSRRD